LEAVRRVFKTQNIPTKLYCAWKVWSETANVRNTIFIQIIIIKIKVSAHPK
jgi:hypothetical protein